MFGYDHTSDAAVPRVVTTTPPGRLIVRSVTVPAEFSVSDGESADAVYAYFAEITPESFRVTIRSVASRTYSTAPPGNFDTM
jgi:hypothetical protein